MAGFRKKCTFKKKSLQLLLCPIISAANHPGVCLSDLTFRDILTNVLHTLLCFCCCCNLCDPLCKNILM